MYEGNGGIGLTVHPHACGEMRTPPPAKSKKFGSSPRVWGNAYHLRRTIAGLRFIPTRVGKWVGMATCSTSLPVHPHACGEMVDSKPCRVRIIGSSPRVWGNVPCISPITPAMRFIPTRVGKWLVLNVPPGPVAVHPHACGEMPPSCSVSPSLAGSSPRVWGNDRIAIRFDGRYRFIPTRVGKCHGPSSASTPAPVHPHACGEMFNTAAPGDTQPGSSPRVWGNAVIVLKSFL